MRTSFNRPRVSLESLIREEEIPVIVDEATVLEEATRPNPELAAAVAEIEARSAAIEHADNETAEFVEAGDNLEAIRAVLEGSLDDSGLDQIGAQVSRLAIAQTLDRVNSELLTPSMESFTTASNRVGNTRLTCEAIGEKLKEIWEAVKGSILKAIAQIGEFLKTLFDKKAKLSDQAQKILAAAGSVSGNPSATTITVPGLGAALQIAGQVPNNWAAQVAAVLGHAEQYAAGAGSAADTLEKSARDIQAMNPTDRNGLVDGPLRQELIGVGRTMSQMALQLRIQGGRTIDAPKALGVNTDQFTVAASPILPGNVFLYVVAPKNTDMGFAQAIAGSGAGLYVASGDNAPGDDIPAASLEDIKELANATIAAMGSLDKHQADWDRWVKAQQALVAAGDALAQKAAGEESSTGAGIQALLRSIPKLAKMSAGVSEGFVKYSFRSASAALKGASATLKLYQPQEAANTTAALPAPATAAA